MSHSKNPNSSLDDDDMHSLFSSNDTQVPAALDAAILTAASEAVVSPHPSKVQSESSAKESSWWRTHWPQGLAAAAVFVLGVTIVPMMISSPESKLRSSDALDEVFEIAVAPAAAPEANTRAISTQQSDTGSFQASREQTLSKADLRAESERLGEPLVGAESGLAGLESELGLESEAGLESEHPTDSKAASKPLRKIAEPASLSMNRDDQNIAQPTTQDGAREHSVADAATDQEPAYRETAKQWVQEIFRLNSAGKKDEARAELKQFLLKHPGSEDLRALPQELLE